MKDNIIHKFIDKVKNTVVKNKQVYPSVSEYAFSSEEIADLGKQNMKKILDLKQEVYGSKKINEPKNTALILNKMLLEKEENNLNKTKEMDLSLDNSSNDNEVSEEVVNVSEKSNEELDKVEVVEVIDEVMENSSVMKNDEVQDERKAQNSFIHLNDNHQELVMSKWHSIDNTEIDRDIINGKDLLNHNYTITYADEAARYIHGIRKKYEVVLCYLIGFNNEKKGIYDKTIFSDKMDNEWKFLSNYIKILEKIRNFKRQ